METTGKQVDSCMSGTQGRFCTTHTSEGATTIYVHIGKTVGILGLGIVDEHVCLCLHGVVQSMMTGEALTTTEDVTYLVICVINRYEMNKGVVGQIGE